jgi:hypothetical protein
MKERVPAITSWIAKWQDMSNAQQQIIYQRQTLNIN